MATAATSAAAAAAAAAASAAVTVDRTLALAMDTGDTVVAIATATHLRLWDVSGDTPVQLVVVDAPGIGRVRMLAGSQLAVLVGSGAAPRFGRDTFRLFNLRHQRLMDERVVESDICGVEVSRTRLVVTLESRVHVYELPKSRHLLTIEKTPDPRGAFCFPQRGLPLVCYSCPEARTGDVAVFDLDKAAVERVITAHDAPVVALAATASGRSIATASENGKLIRLYDTTTGALQRVFRRGQQASIVYGLFFDAATTLLAVVTSRRTIHLFRLAAAPESSSRLGERMWRALTAEDGSFATIAHEEGVDAKVIFMLELERVVVITATGWARRYRVDLVAGGACVKESEFRLLDESVS